jgi:hypothetical protein
MLCWSPGLFNTLMCVSLARTVLPWMHVHVQSPVMTSCLLYHRAHVTVALQHVRAAFSMAAQVHAHHTTCAKCNVCMRMRRKDGGLSIRPVSRVSQRTRYRYTSRSVFCVQVVHAAVCKVHHRSRICVSCLMHVHSFGLVYEAHMRADAYDVALMLEHIPTAQGW